MATKYVLSILDFLRNRADESIQLVTSRSLEEFLDSEPAEAQAFQYNHDIGEGLAHLRDHAPNLVARITG